MAAGNVSAAVRRRMSSAAPALRRLSVAIGARRPSKPPPPSVVEFNAIFGRSASSTRDFDHASPISPATRDSSAPATWDSPLPDGWEAVYDPDSKCYYYRNETTSQWERPSPARRASTNDAAPPAPGEAEKPRSRTCV